MKPPYAIGSVPSLSGHAIAYRWSSLPRVRRHRASKPQGSSERVLPWQITMDQLIFASFSHTHYWYEVGMLKVPAVRSDVSNADHFCSKCEPSKHRNLKFPNLQKGMFGEKSKRIETFSAPPREKCITFRWDHRLQRQIIVMTFNRVPQW